MVVTILYIECYIILTSIDESQSLKVDFRDNEAPKYVCGLAPKPDNGWLLSAAS